MAEEKKPEFQKGKGPNALPQGGASILNRQLQAVDAQAPQMMEAVKPPEQDAKQPELTGFDSIVFGPTDYPEEPITAGAPFGPGAASTRKVFATDDEVVERAVAAMAESPNATSRVKSFAARVLRGE